MGVEIHFNGGVYGEVTILGDGYDDGNFQGIGDEGFDEDVTLEGEVIKRFFLAEDGYSFSVVTAFSGFNNDGISGELLEEFWGDFLGIAQGEGRCGDVVLGEELFL